MDEAKLWQTPCGPGCPYSPEPPQLLRVEDHRGEWEALRARAQEDARRIAQRLVDELGARRVWILGSAAGTWVFHPRSDLDIAVEGPTDDFAWAMREVVQPATTFELDLRDRADFPDRVWEEMRPHPRLLAAREGARAGRLPVQISWRSSACSRGMRAPRRPRSPSTGRRSILRPRR